jgi:sugar diacid utilization regulator
MSTASTTAPDLRVALNRARAEPDQGWDGADLARSSDLVKTLRGYLDANCSQAEAAQCLFIHCKTMRYRLEQIR